MTSALPVPAAAYAVHDVLTCCTGKRSSSHLANTTVQCAACRTVDSMYSLNCCGTAYQILSASVRVQLTHGRFCMQAIFMAEVTSEQTGDIVNFVSSDIRKIYDGMQVRMGFCPDFWAQHRFTLHQFSLHSCCSSVLHAAHLMHPHRWITMCTSNT